jgi:hypothetical protein
MTVDQQKTIVKKQPYWLVYLSFLLAGLLLLSDAYHFAHLAKWTAKLGIALVYSAVSLFIGKGRAVGYVAAVVMWLAVLATIFM